MGGIFSTKPKPNSKKEVEVLGDVAVDDDPPPLLPPSTRNSLIEYFYKNPTLQPKDGRPHLLTLNIIRQGLLAGGSYAVSLRRQLGVPDDFQVKDIRQINDTVSFLVVDLIRRFTVSLMVLFLSSEPATAWFGGDVSLLNDSDRLALKTRIRENWWFGVTRAVDDGNTDPDADATAIQSWSSRIVTFVDGFSKEGDDSTFFIQVQSPHPTVIDVVHAWVSNYIHLFALDEATPQINDLWMPFKGEARLETVEERNKGGNEYFVRLRSKIKNAILNPITFHYMVSYTKKLLGSQWENRFIGLDPWPKLDADDIKADTIGQMYDNLAVRGNRARASLPTSSVINEKHQ